MPRRFNDRWFNDDSEITPEAFNQIVAEFDKAIEALENFRVDWRAQVDLFNTNALKRFNDAVQPIVNQLRTAVDGGFLVAQTADLVELTEGENVNFYIPPEARIAYRPTPFLSIMAPDEYDDWAIGRTIVYNDETGLLTVEILYLNRSGAERSGWTVSASSGIVEAVNTWALETAGAAQVAINKAADALASAEAAALSAGAALASKNAAAGSATTASTQRGLAENAAAAAALSATQAQGYAESISGGPVTSVANLTGVVGASALRIALGLVVGTNVQAYSNILGAIAGLTGAANNDFIQRKSGVFTNRTPAQVLVDLIAAGAASQTGAETLTNKTLTSPAINSPTISSPTINNGYVEESYNFNSGTTTAVNLSNGSAQTVTLTGNWTPSAWPAATAGMGFILYVKQDATGGRTVTWPASVKWPAGVAPTLTATASKADKLAFQVFDGNWIAHVVGQNY